MKKKPDICLKCGNDKNYTHDRDGSQMCWCVEQLRIKNSFFPLEQKHLIRLIFPKKEK